MNTYVRNYIVVVGQHAQLMRQIGFEIMTRHIYWNGVFTQIYTVGVKSIPIIFVVAISVGMVMALQFGIGLEKFGGKLYIPKLVSVSIVRELAPAFGSLMFAARVGAGMTSEIASMVVTQQIDAIRALGASPIQKIIVPRVLACLITLPLLIVFANIVGIGGSLMVGSLDLGLNAGFYLAKVKNSVQLEDFFSGFGKTLFFSLFVAVPACYFGLNTERGTQGVGQATTNAVVTSSILILVGDYFLTKFFWIFETWK